MTALISELKIDTKPNQFSHSKKRALVYSTMQPALSDQELQSELLVQFRPLRFEH